MEIQASRRGRGLSGAGALAICALAVGWYAFPAGVVHAALIDISEPDNLLSGQTVVVSSNRTELAFLPPTAVNDLVGSPTPGDFTDGLIFADRDSSQRLGVTGFDSSIGEILIWSYLSGTGRVPLIVTIRSSTSSLAGASLIDPANYETPLVLDAMLTFTDGSVPFDGGQADFQVFAVAAPPGTRSLFFNFGPNNPPADFGVQIAEVQAFGVVPEPSSVILLSLALLFGAATRRSRPNA